MGVVPENACIPGQAEAVAPSAERTPAQSPAPDRLSYDALLQEYNQLRERSVRTTNALG